MSAVEPCRRFCGNRECLYGGCIAYEHANETLRGSPQERVVPGRTDSPEQSGSVPGTACAACGGCGLLLCWPIDGPRTVKCPSCKGTGIAQAT